MSKGLGTRQLECLQALQHAGTHLATLAIADACQNYSLSATLRALRNLARRGLVTDLGRQWQNGERHWTLANPAQTA